MSRNNDVFRLLVTNGNQAVLAKDKKVTELLPGQIGIFDFNTNLSFDSTVTAAPRNFYLAVGLGADGVTQDIMKSTGSHVQGKNIVFSSFRPYTPGRSMKVVLKNFTATCETEYGIKLELRNQAIYHTQGYNQFAKTYTAKTGCCDCAAPCDIKDANQITKSLFTNVANDPSGFIKANIILRQPIVALTVDNPAFPEDMDTGDVITMEQLDALIEYNKTIEETDDFLLTDLEFETVSQTIGDFNSVSLDYVKSRGTVAIISKVEGFDCTGEVEVTQEAVFEEGAGIDVKQVEYMAKGWTEGPYRVSSANGLADNRNFVTNAATKYDVFALTHDQFSLGGWLEYYHNQATVIAVPTADTVTRNGLAAILDKVTVPQGFDALTDDATAAVADANTVERTTDKTPATDGIA